MLSVVQLVVNKLILREDVLDCGNLNDNDPPSAFFKEWIANGGDCPKGYEYAKRCSTGCQQANSTRRCADKNK
jgi:hypothetical protein